MALIGKIREKSWLILIVVGGALVTFIFTSQGPDLGGGPEEQYGIGTVYGEKVDRDGYNQMYSDAEEVARMNAQRQQQPYQAPDENSIWQRFVENEVLKREFDALGIHVSDKEFDAYLFGTNGFDVLPDIASAPAFLDSSGQFNPNLLEQRIDEMENGDAEMQKQWEQSKKYYIEQRQKQKYFDILGQGIYVTKLEAEEEYLAQQEKKAISYVVRRYSEIDNRDIKVNDDILKKFYEEHKTDKKYQNRFSSRVVRFADIKVVPSAEDTAAFEKDLQTLKAKFAKTKNDSAFVIKNSEQPMFIRQIGYRPEGDPAAKGKEQFTYPKDLDTAFKVAQIGDVIGPYENKGAKCLAKVVDMKTKLLSVRHILIAANRQDTVAVEAAKKKTDSLMALINSDNFEMYVTQFSDDPGSKNTGGKYENFVDGEMVPEFSEFAMEKPVGQIGYVQTDFGFHIMEVLERKDGAVPNLAIVQKSLKPSDNTILDKEKEAYELLNRMSEKIDAINDPVKKVAMFDTIAAKENMLVRRLEIKDNNPQLNGFTPYAETEIFKLAYDKEAQAGDIIGSPIKDGDRWIVAALASVKVKGESNFEDVKALLESDYIEEKKYKMLMAQMRGKSLDQIAQDANTIVVPSEVVFGQSQLGKTSQNEPAVVGALFGSLKDGKMTQPLKGRAGVYVVKIERTIEAQKAVNYDLETNQMMGAQRGRIQNAVTNALLELADVIDNRRFNEIGLRR